MSDELRAPSQNTSSGREGLRLVPILGWLRSYDRRWLRGDLIAGMTVAALSAVAACTARSTLLPKITGTKVTGSNSLQELFLWFGTLGDTHRLTLIVGIVALAVVFGLRMFVPRVPGALVLVVGGLLASWLFDLGAHGVALVGEVPRGLPRFEVPDGGLLWDHALIVARPDAAGWTPNNRSPERAVSK